MSQGESFDDLSTFEAAVAGGGKPPVELDPHLRALWLAKNGEWDAAHDLVNDLGTRTGDWIHALLHVIEGDLSNAGYWYARCGRHAIAPGEVDAEWRRIAQTVIERM